MSSHRRIRPLIIAEAANPTLTSAALVGWSCAKAIAAETDAHIVTEWRNRDDFLRAGLVEGTDFTAINNRRLQHLSWSLATKWRRKFYSVKVAIRFGMVQRSSC